MTGIYSACHCAALNLRLHYPSRAGGDSSYYCRGVGIMAVPVPAKRPRGRQRIYTAEHAAEILRHLGDGGTLTSICARPGFPTLQLVLAWAFGDEKPPLPLFAELYAQARERRYQVWEDQLVDLSDGAIDLDSMAQVHGRKLAVDTKKWIMSRRMPTIWGEHIQPHPNQNTVVNVYLPQKGAPHNSMRTIHGQAEVIEG
jgi:hypothetical protein